ncbi:ribosomal protein L19E [Candidatus Methanoperedens nitroreducens]|uniref:Large ribosomal subunit protein eL19 n=1 Tax=Candidatus Methanoperedens nitratireducens TaxID=1392998 RepID=A0A062VDG8_9EURY|nr:50S ribosomal protein L19e [Candidatus Methanoperedens nitroreducens]KCZ73290.1 ribosomal protein L19E [Candidatus Methanoperedens nitroreducens]MDJ1422761.1 50S ribosomal protein L19e [Candidatus Methanoperedens sp.]
MTDLSNQKRLAAEVMDIGVHRVWLDPEASKDIAAALTREDIHRLIEEDKIGKRPIIGISRVRARRLNEARAYGHRKGHGSRNGAKGARRPRKEQWMKRIRALRKQLRELRENNTIDVSTYRRLYAKAKGGEFRSRAHLKSHVEQLKGKEV